VPEELVQSVQEFFKANALGKPDDVFLFIIDTIKSALTRLEEIFCELLISILALKKDKQNYSALYFRLFEI